MIVGQRRVVCFTGGHPVLAFNDVPGARVRGVPVNPREEGVETRLIDTSALRTRLTFGRKTAGGGKAPLEQTELRPIYPTARFNATRSTPSVGVHQRSLPADEVVQSYQFPAHSVTVVKVNVE